MHLSTIPTFVTTQPKGKNLINMTIWVLYIAALQYVDVIGLRIRLYTYDSVGVKGSDIASNALPL